MKKRTLLSLALLMLLVSFVGCEKSKKDAARGIISWDEASAYIGDYATVEGRVVSTHYAASSRGSPTFLNIGKPYPDKDRFTVVIWGRNRGKFDGAPEETYRSKLIRVSETIDSYKGTAQIEAQTPSQIAMVE